MFAMKKFIAVIALPLAAACAFGQNYAIADLQQDVALLKREIGKLRLEVESLSRENEALRQEVKEAKDSSTSTEGMNATAASLRAEITASAEQNRRDILAAVRKEIDSLASQTNANFEKLASAIGSKPQGQIQASFSESYPKMGVTHTVVRGDTISAIARKYGSTVKWIQDANRIADANRGLVVGQTIFVPTKE